ncbi:MAG: hypothetical protein UU95_C0003G0050 [Parcubacteria group bacterium GW2011_GWC2_42_12]|uniref:Uncharacterized protein n=1 Tax=Candidatus Falkowbacteria bacterium GW2011_GWA2_41_14 TaxID=1618635 RepID=A0A0G0XV16_9BACT|nr:MAG: hypothetical protein UU43_C0002G0051 [Candidatus Falkowbacteria bacterium GW2011_GWA2_41_14]KKS35277.1 MAG: hypothetical protein UU95_C0003G0050 [Parcubacteria group bacterium GW2011_GWC2_42_12]
MDLSTLIVCLIIGILVVAVIALSYSLKKQKQMRRDLRVSLVVQLTDGGIVTVLITSNDGPMLRGHGFLEILPIRIRTETEDNFSAVNQVWEALKAKFANEALTGTQVGPGYHLAVFPKGGTTLVGIVDALKQSGFNVHSCVC